MKITCEFYDLFRILAYIRIFLAYAFPMLPSVLRFSFCSALCLKYTIGSPYEPASVITTQAIFFSQHSLSHHSLSIPLACIKLARRDECHASTKENVGWDF